MRAGDLKKLVSIEHETLTPDGMGGHVSSWTTWASNVWAAIWPISAKEQIQAGQETMIITHRVRVRYRRGLTGVMRIKYGSRYFNIVSVVNPNTDNRMIEMLCRETS